MEIIYAYGLILPDINIERLSEFLNGFEGQVLRRHQYHHNVFCVISDYSGGVFRGCYHAEHP